MYNYMKKFLLILSILMMPSMNIASKAMNPEDYDDTITRSICKKPTEEKQSEVSSFAKQPVSSLSVSLEDATTSKTSYLLSSVKNVANNGYNILDYTVHNPIEAMFIGTVLTLNVIAANPWVVCGCVCNYPNGSKHNTEIVIRPL